MSSPTTLDDSAWAGKGGKAVIVVPNASDAARAKEANVFESKPLLLCTLCSSWAVEDLIADSEVQDVLSMMGIAFIWLFPATVKAFDGVATERTMARIEEATKNLIFLVQTRILRVFVSRITLVKGIRTIE